jgi:hypothetical protein
MEVDDPQPSEKIMQLTEKVQGTKALMLMVLYDQIETKIGADPPDGMLAMAINLAIGAEAVRDSAHGDEATLIKVLNQGTNRQKMIDALDMLEHTVACLKEVIPDA